MALTLIIKITYLMIHERNLFCFMSILTFHWIQKLMTGLIFLAYLTIFCNFDLSTVERGLKIFNIKPGILNSHFQFHINGTLTPSSL